MTKPIIPIHSLSSHTGVGATSAQRWTARLARQVSMLALLASLPVFAFANNSDRPDPQSQAPDPQSQALDSQTRQQQTPQNDNSGPNAELTPLPPLDVEPELVGFVEADYPERELAEGVEGQVVLELLVNESGAVDSVSVLRGLTPNLDRAAVAAARQFTFSPAYAGEQAVPVQLQFAYDFSIREQAARVEDRLNLQGTLRERGTRQPITEAMVVAEIVELADGSTHGLPLDAYLERIGQFPGQHLEEDRLVTFSDSTGAFAFRSLPPGKLRLRFPNTGYESPDVEEELGEDERLDVAYWLTRTSYNDYEIVVYGKDEEREVTRQSLSVSEIENLPGFGGDVIKSVQALPGVARPSMTDAGAVIVRGSGNYDSRFFLDGVDIPLLFHFGGVKSTYNSLSLGSLDLYPGGYGTRYGGVVGGVVELKGRPAKRDRWHRVVDASLLDASFHAEGPLGDDWGLTVTGRRSFVGEVASAVISRTDDVNLAIAPYYWDTVLRLDRHAKAGDQMFLTLFAAGDRTEVVFPDVREGSAEVNRATNSIETSIRFGRLIYGWDKRFGGRFQNELRAAIGRDKEEGHVFGAFDFDFDGPYYQLRDEFSMEIRPGVIARAGVDMAYTPLDYQVKVVGERTTTQKSDLSDLGAYGSFEFRPTDRLTLTPGFRYDYYTHLKEGSPSYRLSGRYQANDRHTLTASIGTYNQDPQPIGQATDPVYGNPELPPTDAIHTTLGDEWRINDRLSLKVEGYYNRQSNIPMVTDSLDLNFVADVDGRMYGLEFMLRHEQGDRFFGWLSYSMARSERRFPRRPSEESGFDDIATAEGQTWDPDAWVRHAYDQTHHFEAVGSLRLGNNISTGARVQYATGNPVTPYLNYVGNQFEYDADSGEYVPLGGSYLSERFDPFFRVDARVDTTFVRKNYLMSVYFDLQNISYFFYKSPEAYNYNYDYSKRNAYGFVPIPAVGVRFEF